MKVVDAAVASPSDPAPPPLPLLLLHCGQLCLVSLKLDHHPGAGAAELRGVDCDVSIPALEVSLTAKVLHSTLQVLACYSPASVSSTAAHSAADYSSSSRRGAGVAAGGGGGDAEQGAESALKSARARAMERLLAVDPALRTLIWLENNERQRSEATSAAGRQPQPPLAKDDIDFARVANLMKQVHLLHLTTDAFLVVIIAILIHHSLLFVWFRSIDSLGNLLRRNLKSRRVPRRAPQQPLLIWIG